jgi:hypothetical protein
MDSMEDPHELNFNLKKNKFPSEHIENILPSSIRFLYNICIYSIRCKSSGLSTDCTGCGEVC